MANTRKVKVPDPFIQLIDEMKAELNRQMKNKGAKREFSRQHILNRLGTEVKNDPNLQDRVIHIKTRGKKAFKQ